MENKTINNIATLGKRELRYTELKGEKKLDIREWKNDKPLDGARFTFDELQEFVKIKDTGKIGNKTVSIVNGEYCLSIEHNGRTYTRPVCTLEEMDKLREVTKEKTCLSHLLLYKEPEVKRKPGRPKKNADTETQTEKPKDNIIQFPKQRPEVEKVVTEGNATYEDCENKIAEERKMFKDADSQYVIDGLLELCKVDQDFRNNFMRKEKTYAGSFKYFSDMARNGYAVKFDGVTYLDNDMALGMAIDYFNSKVEEPPKKTTETVKKKKTTTKKKTTKKASGQ